ncbi:MAG: hypothetical protein E6I52_06655 [Chloroflexi bacterium]|nr:MAG: hypothetical protein E6I52_06655 [Chloroflexota bacterium]
MEFRFSILALAAILGAAAWSSGAAAEAPGTGTVTGRVIFCKLLPRPVEAPDADVSPLADVTPGMNRGVPPPIRLPVANDVRTVTDGGGVFTLSGVPASQPLVLVAQLSPGPMMVLSQPNLMVSAGQTLDLGTVGLGGCADGGTVLVPQPPLPTATSPVTGGDTPADAALPAPADETAPAADETAPATDEAN